MPRLECQFSVSEKDLSDELAEVLKSKRPYMRDEKRSKLARQAVERIKGHEAKNYILDYFHVVKR